MSESQAVVTTQNLELSPVRVTYKGRDLGATLGNVVLTTKYMKAPMYADQWGKTVADRAVSGLEISITTELAEVINKDNWKDLFHPAKLVGTGAKGMYFDNAVGRKDSADAGILLLHPLSLPDANLSRDHKFYKAIPSAESEITYGPDQQARLKCVWNVLPDDSVIPARFYFHGDPAIGLVAATAGSPVFTGTGNGTLTSVAVYSGVTQTETITVKCIAAPGAHQAIFEVSGSLSGILGNFSLPGSAGGSVNVVTPVISFTITDGTTDFAVNDQWTIPTVAANYI